MKASFFTPLASVIGVKLLGNLRGLVHHGTCVSQFRIYATALPRPESTGCAVHKSMSDM